MFNQPYMFIALLYKIILTGKLFMYKRRLIIGFVACLIVISFAGNSYAFWIWTPKSKTMINPKFAVKDTPREQYDLAMRFFKQKDFKRAADEFSRLTAYYPDSDLAPESQYYAGRAYEEQAKYYYAFQNYQKTLDHYPYTRRMEEIIKREYNIANIFQEKETPKLMILELSVYLDRAATIYAKIVENAPFGEYADKSLYNMAECYRRMLKYKEAVESYERIINDYPDSKLVPEARYQLAYTKYEASLSPEYDQGSTEQALEDFQRISKSTPVPAIAKEAQDVLKKLRERKAESDFRVAEFYEKRKKYRSALIYYTDVVEKFPNTEAARLSEERIEIIKKRIKD